MVGEYIEENGKGLIKLDDEKVKINLHINREDSLGAMPGHKVLVKIGAKMKDNNYRGYVIKILGHKNDPGVDILSIAAKYNITDLYPEEVTEELEDIPSIVTEKDKMTESFKDNEAVINSIPMKKMGSPEDVANLAFFLADSSSDYITGEVIRVDGGLAI